MKYYEKVVGHRQEMGMAEQGPDGQIKSRKEMYRQWKQGYVA